MEFEKRRYAVGIVTQDLLMDSLKLSISNKNEIVKIDILKLNY